MITVREILIQRLRAMGADGLATTDCGCGIDDLAPGWNCLDIDQCKAARLNPLDGLYYPIDGGMA